MSKSKDIVRISGKAIIFTTEIPITVIFPKDGYQFDNGYDSYEIMEVAWPTHAGIMKALIGQWSKGFFRADPAEILFDFSQGIKKTEERIIPQNKQAKSININ